MDEIKTGNIEQLMGYHVSDIKENKAQQLLPWVFLRIGSVLTDPKDLLTVVLNSEQNDRGQELIDTYLNSGIKPSDIIDPDVLDMSLNELLAFYIYQEPKVMLKEEQYAGVRDMLYGSQEPERLSKADPLPVVRDNIDRKAIKYNLLVNPSEENSINLDTKVRDCLTYFTMPTGDGPLGVFAVDLRYSTHGKGGN
jgi:hypothetical protein